MKNNNISKSYRVLTKNDFGAWEYKSIAFISKELSYDSKIIYDWEIINLIDAPDEVFASIINQLPINRIIELDINEKYSKDERKKIISILNIKEGKESIRRLPYLLKKVKISKNLSNSLRLLIKIIFKSKEDNNLIEKLIK
ncbi:MAG: hypothetical protein QMD25_03725 [Caldisericia bacterium]|jgi:hypothetical protein|nr:hypothetical protein [Caldisericia bacterium]